MSATLVKPFHLAVAIQYALIHRDIKNGGEQQSLAAYFFKSMELKLKCQHQEGKTPIQEDKNISDFDKSLFIEVQENDFFDVDLYRSENFEFLARLILTSNFQALEDRYGAEYIKDMNLDLLTQFVFDQKKQAYKYAKEMSFLAFIKLMDCIKYQCSEMKNYKGSLCESFIDLTTYHVIRIQPEYFEFPWELREENC